MGARLFLLALLLTASAVDVGRSVVRADVIGGVEFPLGNRSFADSVVSFEPVIQSGNPAPEYLNAQSALGPPNYQSDNAFPQGIASAVSLGIGGRITLAFTDNALTGSGDSRADLWVFEVGPDAEDTSVEVSRDGIRWYQAGRIAGGTRGIDIDALGFGPADRFYFVRLTDAGNGTPWVTGGADIDAVGAISTVAVGLPNLTPYQPGGWSDKIVVSRTPGTTTNSTGLTTADTLYVNWAVINNGSGPATNRFDTTLYIDGVAQESWYTDPPLATSHYASVEDYLIGSFSAGTHTIKITADSTGVIAESNEGDNDYTKTFTVSPAITPNLTPYQPSGWSDKIVVSRTPGTTTNSTGLTTADTLYVNWAVINNGTGPATNRFYSALDVDGVSLESWSTDPPLAVDGIAWVKDYSIGSLSAGAHTIRITVDSTGVIAESNEGDNSYSKTINLAAVVYVNYAPSFTKGADITVNENAGPQTVANWATGISAGPGNEAGQKLTFTLTPDNTALFSVQPALDVNGTLAFTPAANSSGVATVTVVLKDDGGTANGGHDTSPVQTFTVTVRPAPTGNLLMTLDPAKVRNAGAQWRRVGTSVWFDSGATESGVAAGSYQVEFKPVSGWDSPPAQNLTVQAGQTVSGSAEYPQPLAAPATLTGVVTDALNGQPLANVTVSAGSDANLTDLSGRYVLTNLTVGVLKADFDADVTSGNAPLTVHFVNLSTTTALTLTGEKSSYATYRNTGVTVTPGQTNQLNFSLSPVLTQGMRAVLNWGPLPKDLDLHLQIEGTSHHVSFNDKNTPYGRLDHDVTEGWGPETLTVDQFYPGLYHYYVQHYDAYVPGSRLTNSAAQVHLYRGAEELKVVSVPASGTGAFWHVCTVDGETGAIRVINQITDSAALPGGAGGDTGGSTGGGGLAGVQFLWDFGDGTTSADESPVKVYAQAGNYTVSLRVDGENGQSDVQVASAFVTVLGGSGPRLGAQWVGGRPVLSVSGAVGKTYRIEATSGLGPEAAWQTMTTVTLTSPVQTWEDDQSGNLTTRFYRAVLP